MWVLLGVCGDLAFWARSRLGAPGGVPGGVPGPVYCVAWEGLIRSLNQKTHNLVVSPLFFSSLCFFACFYLS